MAVPELATAVKLLKLPPTVSMSSRLKVLLTSDRVK